MAKLTSSQHAYGLRSHEHYDQYGTLFCWEGKENGSMWVDTSAGEYDPEQINYCPMCGQKARQQI